MNVSGAGHCHSPKPQRFELREQYFRDVSSVNLPVGHDTCVGSLKLPAQTQRTSLAKRSCGVPSPWLTTPAPATSITTHPGPSGGQAISSVAGPHAKTNRRRPCRPPAAARLEATVRVHDQLHVGITMPPSPSVLTHFIQELTMPRYPDSSCRRAALSTPR